MILSTTSNIENYRIEEYLGLAFGEVVVGTNFAKDIGASFMDLFGGRVGGYENDFINARQEAIDEMVLRATKIGANAIIGIKFDYESLGQSNTILMVTVRGTAVKAVKEEK